MLINEKLLIFKDDYKRLAKTRLLNDQRTGNILYEDKLKEEIQKLKKIEIEKELMMNKVNNLQKNQAIPEKESQQIEDDESVNDDDLEVKKIHALKNKLDEINSDLDNLSDKSGVSDCTSMTSTNSFSSFKDQPVNDLQKELSRSSNEANDRKEFIKLVLKIKFEKLHNSHKGQNVNERSLYEECQRNQIPKDRWPEFILQELNTPAKYLSQTRKSLKKVCSLAHLR